jgi:non-heme chloroperoxidase
MPTVDVNGTRLYYEENGVGPALLFVHGLGTSGRAWDAQLPEFTGTHRVVTVDWRGCGRSAKPMAGNDVPTIVADLAGLITALGLGRPVVVGSSLGGTIVTELGLAHPELVSGVVVVGGPAHAPGRGMDVSGIVAGLRDDRVRTIAGWVPDWFAPGVSAELIAWTIRQFLESSVFIDRHLDVVNDYDPRPALPGLRVPIRYLHGDLDAIPLRIPREQVAVAPDAALTVLPGAGHMPHLDHPAEFNLALRAALVSIAAATVAA